MHVHGTAHTEKTEEVSSFLKGGKINWSISTSQPDCRVSLTDWLKALLPRHCCPEGW